VASFSYRLHKDMVANLKLNNGHEMPIIGFGVWKVPNEIAADTVYNAIKAGYRLIDGAFDYANEKECGQGVKRAINEGIVKRSDLFITSKLWNTFHEKERVEPIVRKQLEWWGLEYFDLFHIHFPVALEYVDPDVAYPSGWTTPQGKVVQSKATIQETYQALEALVDKGLIKSIGVSNFQGSLIMDVLRYAHFRPAVLQIEHHPYLVQQEILRFAKDEGIAVTAYSTFGPQSFIELDMAKAKATPKLFEHNTILSISSSHNKSPAQVILRWCTQRGIAIIPKSNSLQRLQENLSSGDFDLTEDEIKAISALDIGLRFNNPPDYLGTLYIFA